MALPHQLERPIKCFGAYRNIPVKSLHYQPRVHFPHTEMLQLQDLLAGSTIYINQFTLIMHSSRIVCI